MEDTINTKIDKIVDTKIRIKDLEQELAELKRSMTDVKTVFTGSMTITIIGNCVFALAYNYNSVHEFLNSSVVILGSGLLFSTFLHQACVCQNEKNIENIGIKKLELEELKQKLSEYRSLIDGNNKKLSRTIK